MKNSSIKLRSREWFNNPSNPDMTALYLERYLNFGFTLEELQSDRPIIGIAQTGSDLVPCNRIHTSLVVRIKEGIRDAGGIPLEFPVHPIQETGRRPTAALDRNLQCLSLIEVLHGYPLDGVVLTTGCDKTTPALIMGAASCNIPAIAISGGPMLNGHFQGCEVGSGTVIWDARKRLQKGEITTEEFMALAASSAPSDGHCNTMGTALTMNCLTEVLGMMLPGSASIPAPYRERAQTAYATGKQSVTLVRENITPSKILTREAFINAIITCSALGGSTNAPIHINAIAAHMGVKITMQDWQTYGHSIPQLVNCKPVGKYLAEDFHKAGGMNAIVRELLKHHLLNEEVLSITNQPLKTNYAKPIYSNPEVIQTYETPVTAKAGFIVLSGNLFDSAVMKVSAIDDAFRQRYLSTSEHPNVFTGRAVVFDGPEHYHQAIDDPTLKIDEDCILVMRGVGPKAYPGSAEVVNMQPPKRLLEKGVNALPTIGDGRQSGTSGSPSILNASPEAADGGGLAYLKTGDYIQIDLNKLTCNALIDDNVWQRRKTDMQTGIPESQTWWQEIYRANVSSLADGGVFKNMTAHNNIIAKTPRHSH